MKTRIYFLAGALLVFCLLGWTGLSQSMSTPKQVWEYKVVISLNTREADLNNLGADGWELVQFSSFTEASATKYVFKRAK